MFEFHHLEQDFVVATAGNVLMIHWFGATSIEGLQFLDGVADRLLQAYPAGISHLVTVHQSAEIPSPLVRPRLHSSLGRLADRTLASSVVVEGEGFAMAAKRGVMTGISMVLRRAYPLHIFSQTDRAVDRLYALDAIAGIGREQLITDCLKLGTEAPLLQI